jgi:AcrR family transcriptional regulator
VGGRVPGPCRCTRSRHDDARGYSLFGSKDGLLIEALAGDAFEFLYTEIAKLEETDDPAADLVAIGVPVFRRLALEHPALYRIAFQRIVSGLDAGPELLAARDKAWEQLVAKVERLESATSSPASRRRKRPSSSSRCSKGWRTPSCAVRVLRTLPAGKEEQAWRNALATLVRRFAAE